MATDLTTPSNTLAKMRWKEPYVSEGLNKKLNGLIPAGVIRGGKLTTSGVALNVTIQDDPETGDSVYSFIDSNGHQVTFRQVGDVALDLTAVVSTTVYIGLQITYSISAATVVKWRAFSLSEIQADPTIVVLGRVVVPGSGIIPAANITDYSRMTAWKGVSQYMREAKQICENGAFEIVGRSVTGGDDNPCPGWDYANISSSNLAYLFTNSGTPQVGDTHFQVWLTGGLNSYCAMVHKNVTQCRGGETITVKFWIKGDSLAPGPGLSGHMGIRLEASDEDPTNIIQTEYIEDLTLSGTWAYTEIEKTFQLDNDARWFGFAIFYDDNNKSSNGSVYFDDIRVWIEQPQVSEGQIENYGPLSHGDIIARGLGVGKPWSAASTIQEFVQNILSLRNDGSTDTYKFARGDSTLNFILQLLNGGLNVENLLTLGSNKVGSDADAQEPRITSEFRDGSAVYTLLWQLDNSNSGRCNLRLYVTSNSTAVSNGAEAFCIISNASFDSTTDTWSRDQSGIDSYRWDFSPSGLFMARRPNTEADGWNENGWIVSGGEKIIGFDATYNAAFYDILKAYNTCDFQTTVKLGDGIDHNSTVRATPRIEADLNGSVSNSYTCLGKFTNNSGVVDDNVYLYMVYSPTAGLGSSNAGFCIVHNAEWNGTQWSRQEAIRPSKKFDFSPYGLGIYQRAQSESSPWSDSGWESSADKPHFALESKFSGTSLDPETYLFANNGRLELGTDIVGIETNPPYDDSTVLPNTLYSKNIVKAWAKLTVTGVGGTSMNIQVRDGFNISGTAELLDSYVYVYFTEALDGRDNNAYLVHCDNDVSEGGGGVPYYAVGNYTFASGGQVLISIFDYLGALMDLEVAGDVYSFNLIVIGTQS